MLGPDSEPILLIAGINPRFAKAVRIEDPKQRLDFLCKTIYEKAWFLSDVYPTIDRLIEINIIDIGMKSDLIFLVGNHPNLHSLFNDAPRGSDWGGSSNHYSLKA